MKILEDTDIFLVNIDNFSKFVWTDPLNRKIAQPIKDSFENNLISSKRKRIFIKSDRGKELFNIILSKFLT